MRFLKTVVAAALLSLCVCAAQNGNGATSVSSPPVPVTVTSDPNACTAGRLWYNSANGQIKSCSVGSVSPGNGVAVNIPDYMRVVDYPGWAGASSDIGLVIGQILALQCNIGIGAGGVTLEGLAPGKYYANTDPIGYARATHSNTGCVYKIKKAPGIEIVTSVGWTTGPADIIDADEPGQGEKTAPGSNEMLEFCATSGGCGPNNYPAATAFTNTSGEEPLVFIASSFTTPSSLATSQITVPAVTDGTNGSCTSSWRGVTKTNTGTANCANLLTVGGYIVFAPNASPTVANCRSGSAGTCHSAQILAKSGTEPTYTLTLNLPLNGFTGLVASTSYFYVIYQPNITPLLWVAGSNGSSYETAQGGKIGKIFLDGEGVAGFVGIFTTNTEEATDLQAWVNFDNQQQTGTRAANQGPAAACTIADKSFQSADFNVGFGHASYHLQNCGPGNGGVTFTPVGSVAGPLFGMTNWETDCHIYEAYALTSSNASDGPNGQMELGTCTGTSSAWINNDLVAEAIGRIDVAPMHNEYTARSVWLGPQNLTYGVTLHGISTANNGGAPAQCGSVPCQIAYLDTFASYGNTVDRGTSTIGFSNVDVVTDVANPCPGTFGQGSTTAPCILNSTSSSGGRKITGAVLSQPYSQANANDPAQVTMLPPGWLAYYGNGTSTSTNTTSATVTPGVFYVGNFSCSGTSGTPTVLTDSTSGKPYIIRATGTITIGPYCTIVASGNTVASGDIGAAGGGGGYGAAAGAAGGASKNLFQGGVAAVLAGGAAGTSGTPAGSAGAAMSSSSYYENSILDFGPGEVEGNLAGGAPGGAGGSSGGAAGTGGGVIILDAPFVVLSNTAIFTVTGGNGGAGGSNIGGGGGGGGGAVIIRSPNLTDNGATFNVGGGAGGTGATGTAGNGGPGGAGWFIEIPQ